MSFGAISPDPAEGPYVPANVSSPIFDKNALVHHPYLSDRKIDALQQLFQIAPEKYARINELIGMVVLRIQQMSFIPMETAEKFAKRFVAEHRGRTERAAEEDTLLEASEFGHVTTLSPDSLTQAIRLAVDQIMLVIGDEFLSDAAKASVQAILEQVRARVEMSEKDGLRVHTVLDTEDIESQWPARADFLSTEARNMLHTLDPTLEPPVDLMTQRIAEYFSVHSELSKQSFMADHSPAHDRLPQMDSTHPSYSTLNPADVIEMMDSHDTENIISPLIFGRMVAAVPARMRK